MALAAIDPATGERRATALGILEPGETVSISKRIPTSFGLNPEEYTVHVDRIRGTMDSQVSRARRNNPGRRYVVENVASLTSRGDAILITVAATRVE